MPTSVTLDELIPKLLLHARLDSRGPVFLVGDDHVSHAAIEALRRGLPSEITLRSHVMNLDVPFSYDMVTQEKAETDAPGIAVLHGLEYLRTDQVRKLLTSLNLRRDQLRDSTSLLIIWVPESVLERFSEMCPDLFAWRALITRFSIPMHPKELFQHQLVGYLSRFSDMPSEGPATDPDLVEFRPEESGGPGPPRGLPGILGLERRVWLMSTDREATTRAIWNLAQRRAQKWLAEPEGRSLLVPLMVGEKVESRFSARLWILQDVGGWPVDQWLESGWATLVLIDPAPGPGAASERLRLAAKEFTNAFPDVRIGVLAGPGSSAPTDSAMAPWVTWSEAPFRLQNTRRLREAEISETALERLESLGILDVPPAIARRLAESYSRERRLSSDGMGLLEMALDLPTARAFETAVLKSMTEREVAEVPAVSEEGGLCARLLVDGLAEMVEERVPVTSLSARLLLATRALVHVDFDDTLGRFDILGRPESRQVFDLAIRRKLHTHGPEWAARHLEPLLSGLTYRKQAQGVTLALQALADVSDSGEAGSGLLKLGEDLLPKAKGSVYEALQAAISAFGQQAAKRPAWTMQRPAEGLQVPRMTDEAKKALSRTIRELRTRLLEDLRAAMEGAYRFSVPAEEAGLSEAARVKRARLEEWFEEQVRADESRGEKKRRHREDFQAEVVKQAAYTLLNRLVILRLMETAGLRKPLVVSGGWESQGYKDFREIAQALVREDETEGYAFLLQLIFEDLAQELPGLYGSAGLADMVPVPAATLRAVVEAFDDKVLFSCWTDDMTLGWIYQYWNDPEREALDAKLNSGGKVEPHEIASKTQMFTERYMVDWLLQNSLGPMWLAMCKKHGWTPEAESKGTLADLEERRVEWRRLRDEGEVELTELMPLYSDEEQRWAYFVPQPIPEDAVEQAPESVRDLKILDPAVGSGHFLVVAFDLLVSLYLEEARHRGEAGEKRWDDRGIVERILEHNLHGIDLDPRAVQIAAASLWLKAQQVCAVARPRRMNLVASNLRLGSLPDDDPALVELRLEVERETGIPGALTDTIVQGLKGADHLGSLLKVDAAVEGAIAAHEAELGRTKVTQTHLFEEVEPAGVEPVDREVAKASVLERIEGFLGRHSRGDDLGLKLRGEQLAAGVRFVRIVREGSYELVVGNPPYQGTTKMADVKYIRQHYPKGKADLYAAFLERGLQLARTGGASALLTMRNWMFIKQYADLRSWLLSTYDLKYIGDLKSGAFEEISAAQVVVSVVMSITIRSSPSRLSGVAMRFFDEDTVLQVGETKRKRAAALCHREQYELDPMALKVVPEWPLIYWWSTEFRSEYSEARKLYHVAPPKKGMTTSNNSRYIRYPWEISSQTDLPTLWAPYVLGSKGKAWFEPVSAKIRWTNNGLDVKVLNEKLYGSFSRSIQNEAVYFKIGIAFTTTGSSFTARIHRLPSVIDSKGSSIYGEGQEKLLCLLNSSKVRNVLDSLNPSLDYKNGDIERIPIFPIHGSEQIFATISDAFISHESHRETSIEFRQPGPSPWRHAQAWAQATVDRLEDAPIASYDPEYDPEPSLDHLSFAIGVALGRFESKGEGILNPEDRVFANGLPAGILCLDGTLDTNDHRDSLGHDAAKPLESAWTEHGPNIDAKTDLRTYLRTKFFPEVHKGMYENRPIHWPLSSEKKTFVAWINIHRWTEDTLRILQADHLNPALIRTEGELADLREARQGADKKAARQAEGRFAKVQKWHTELTDFIAAVEQCAEKGAPPTDPKCQPRETDARYAPDLDDGVMINSAALWPLLLPQWKDPKKWWKELSTAKGRKDYDWSHLAMRYWPTRVDEKCQKDPSLGVAHGCFWAYHPERAWSWELRLQDEIAPDFRIEEAPYRDDGGDSAHREAYLRDHAPEALQTIEKEILRRRRKTKQPQTEFQILESGLWSTLPEACWDLESTIIKKQQHNFRFLAPDEPEARAAFIAARPGKVRAREELLEEIQPKRTLYDDQLA